MYFIMVVLFMAIVQGICEFIPISSSGHLLVIGRWLLPEEVGMSEAEQVALNVLLHAGTLFSILFVYRRLIVRMLLHDRRLLAMVLVASVPTALTGLGIKYHAYWLETNLTVTAIGFLVTAFLLLTVVDPIFPGVRRKEPLESDRVKDTEISTFRRLSFCGAILVGLFQGLAVLPGFSRSGLTLSASIYCGLERKEAAGFSFLIAIPALSGAILVELLPLLGSGVQADAVLTRSMTLLIIAFFLSFAVGVLSLRFLIRWLQNGSLRYWALWLVLLGIFVLVRI